MTWHLPPCVDGSILPKAKGIVYRNLYINTKPLSSVSNSAGLTVLFHIFRVDLSVLFEVARMLIKPLFDPWVIIFEVVRIPFPPAGIDFHLMGFLAERISAGLLTFTYSWVGYKQSLTITAPFPFHPGPLSKW